MGDALFAKEANRRVRELAEPRRMPVKGNKFFEIVLIKDHERLGSAGDTMKVRKGYYRNILWPQGFAQRASADVVQELENKAAAMDKKSQAAMKGQIEAKKKIEKGGKPYIFGKKVRPGTENIYGSLSQINVAEAVIRVGLSSPHRFNQRGQNQCAWGILCDD